MSIDLQANKLSKMPTFANVANLEELDASRNQIEGVFDMEALSKWLPESFRRPDVSQNRLSRLNTGVKPGAWRAATNLQHVDISSNAISGSASEFCDICRLQPSKTATKSR